MGQHWLLVCAVALAADVAPEIEELARRRLSKVGVVFLEDDDAVNIQWRAASECTQNRKRDHSLPSFLETTRVDGVKASLHNRTPRSHLARVVRGMMDFEII